MHLTCVYTRTCEPRTDCASNSFAESFNKPLAGLTAFIAANRSGNVSRSRTGTLPIGRARVFSSHRYRCSHLSFFFLLFHYSLLFWLVRSCRYVTRELTERFLLRQDRRFEVSEVSRYTPDTFLRSVFITQVSTWVANIPLKNGENTSRTYL